MLANPRWRLHAQRSAKFLLLLKQRLFRFAQRIEDWADLLIVALARLGPCTERGGAQQ